MTYNSFSSEKGYVADYSAHFYNGFFEVWNQLPTVTSSGCSLITGFYVVSINADSFLCQCDTVKHLIQNNCRKKLLIDLESYGRSYTSEKSTNPFAGNYYVA